MPTTMETVKQWGRDNGSPLEQRVWPEASGQTFKRGDLVKLVSGKVTVVAVSSGKLTSSGDEPIGIANQDASGVVDTAISVDVLSGAARWVLPAYHATAASAITAVADVGAAGFQLFQNAAGQWAVSIADTSTPVVQVVAIHGQYSTGTQYGWYVVKFLSAELQLKA